MERVRASGFREARMISPSPAQIEKGELLKNDGKRYQIIGMLLLISGCITGFYYLINWDNYYFIMDDFNFIYVFWAVISIFLGTDLILKGKKKVNVGEKLFKDILIPSDFSGMNGHKFNDYIVKIYSAMDYTCEDLPKSGDRGADFLAEKDGVRYVVQTKRWKNKVGDSTIQKLVGAKAWYSADKAICVTNSDYTKPARQWENRGVELINGKRLDEIIIELQKNNKRTKQ